MKELFTGVLSVSISASIIICLTLLLRVIVKKVPKTLICLLWGLVILRLLIPFRFESPVSLRPETPVFSKADTSVFATQQQDYWADELPSFVPSRENANNERVVIDYFAIASAIWAAVVAGMLLYTLVTYIQLKHRVRQAVRIDKNIYECGSIDTPFLLGYLRPKIYLPTGMSSQNADLVIAHEKNHIRRGDNWFKLISFVCLSLHWFNPLVWIAYMMICKDIEDACDESVVRNLDEQGRREYSTALLACGKGKRSFAACPVAFGENSLRQRIMNVLHYKKPALWISITVVVLIVALAVFFMTDPVTQEPPYYKELLKSIGQPIEIVCQNMGKSLNDLEMIDPDYNSVYLLKSAVTYMDVTFDLRLMCHVGTGAFSRFDYIAQIPGDREKAAAAATKIAQQCLNAFGDPAQDTNGTDSVSVTDVTEEKLVEIYNIERRPGIMQALWQITETVPQETIDYLLQYRQSEVWKMRSMDSPVLMYPEMGMWLQTSRDLETDIITIRIQVSTGTAGKNRYTPYPERSWWDKVQDWLN